MTENMVDMILSAEDKSDKNIAAAKAEADGIMKKAQDECAAERESAVAEELDKKKQRLAQTEEDCRAASEKRLAAQRAEIEEAFAAVSAKKDGAVKYILGRLV